MQHRDGTAVGTLAADESRHFYVGHAERLVESGNDGGERLRRSILLRASGIVAQPPRERRAWTVRDQNATIASPTIAGRCRGSGIQPLLECDARSELPL